MGFSRNIAGGVTAKLQFRSESLRLLSNIGALSAQVDQAFNQMKKPKSQPNRGPEIVTTAIESKQDLQIPVYDDTGAKLYCSTVPFGLNLMFFDRSYQLQLLRKKLGRGEHFKAVGIYGLGGVGKSQLALQYANTAAR